MSDEPLPPAFALMQEASQQFDLMINERHKMGAEKYGAVAFLSVDSIEMALEEIADLANYARYTFIKLYLMREQLMTMIPQMADAPPDTQIGPGAVANPYGR